MNLVYPPLLFTLAISILGSVFGVVCLVLFAEINQRPKTVMAKFKFNPDRTERDFRNMFYANASLTAFMVLLGIGAILDVQKLINISYFGLTVSALVIVEVIGSWVFNYT